MAAATKRIPELYEELQKQLDIAEFETEDYEPAVAVCNEVLKRDDSDSDAIRTKCFCLIQQRNWAGALKCAIKGSLQFERAYALYRLNNHQESLNVIDEAHKHGEKTVRLLHLKAQILYRLERHEEGSALYDEILKSDTSTTGELYTNATASAAMANRSATVVKGLLAAQKDEDDQRYELPFNTATAFVYAGDFEGAKKYLKEAESLCEKTCASEGFTKAEIQDEQSIILVQLAFVLQMLGEGAKALELYMAVLKNKPSDKTVVAVASNNIIALNKDSDLFDSFKRAKAALAAESKLTTRQREVISFNRCLLLLKMGKWKDCGQHLAKLKSQYPKNERLCVLEAALLVRQKRSDAALSLLESYIASNPDDCSNVQLAAVQLLLIQGNLEAAATALQSITFLAHEPGVVATLLALYAAATPRLDSKAAQVLQEAVVHWTARVDDEDDEESEPAARALVMLTELRAGRALEAEDWRAAAAQYESLTDSSSKVGSLAMNSGAAAKMRWSTGLMTAYSYFDLSQAERRAKALPMDSIVSNDSAEIDPEELERLPVQKAKEKMKPKRFSGASKSSSGADKNNAEVKQAVAKDVDAKDVEKRKALAMALRRKARLLKKRVKQRETHVAKLRERGKLAADAPLPEVDPDRWLPKRERASFKGARNSRRGRKNYASGAQGAGDASKKDAAKYDAAARAARGESLTDGGNTTASKKVSSTKNRRRKKKKKSRR